MTSLCEASSSSAWSKPYYGVSHLGQLADDRWATITDYSSFVELTGWFRSCGTRPNEATFDTVEQAKAAGERWVSQGIFSASPASAGVSDPARDDAVGPAQARWSNRVMRKPGDSSARQNGLTARRDGNG